jgi:hypothetical protein
MKGFYFVSSVSKNKSNMFSLPTLQEKLLKETVQAEIKTIVISEENKIPVVVNPERKKITSFNLKRTSHLTINKKKFIKQGGKPHDVPDEHLNHIAKAGFRLSIFSLLFFLGGLYVFSELALIYITLGLFIISFIFALVALISSISAGKDRIATDRKGLRFSRFGVTLSLLIFAAIAAFFILTPIII